VTGIGSWRGADAPEQAGEDGRKQTEKEMKENAVRTTGSKNQLISVLRQKRALPASTLPCIGTLQRHYSTHHTQRSSALPLTNAVPRAYDQPLGAGTYVFMETRFKGRNS
jgi:hypothetical protein